MICGTPKNSSLDYCGYCGRFCRNGALRTQWDTQNPYHGIFKIDVLIPCTGSIT